MTRTYHHPLTARPVAARLSHPLCTASLVGLAACGNPDFPNLQCKDFEGTCVEVLAEEPGTLLDTVNSLTDDTTVLLSLGTFSLDNAVTIRDAVGITLVGQGMDDTTLDFAAVATQTNGVDVVGDQFRIADLAIVDAKKDGLRIEDSTDVAIQRVRVTWSAGPSADNGAYGLYPVKSTNVLIEDSEAFNASDAGLYVGQSQHVIVRNNVARGNVAGIEIENTQFADVYGNLAEDNTGGLLIFDLPGNPIVGRDIKVHDNVVQNNNRDNFAPGGTVRMIPAGTGTVVVATRRVELFDNTYGDNNTSDIAIFSGLVIDGTPANWAIPRADLFGDIEGLDLLGDETAVMNFRTSDVYVHDNATGGSGGLPDTTSPEFREIGVLLGIVYAGQGPVDNVLYDAIGESAFSPTEASGNSNDNHICVAATGTFASLNLPYLAEVLGQGDFPSTADLYRPAPPHAPFDCTSLTGGPIADVTLPEF